MCYNKGMKIKLTYDQLFQKHLEWLARKGNQSHWTLEDEQEIDDLITSELEYDTQDLVRIQDKVRAAGIKNCFLLTRNIADLKQYFQGNIQSLYAHCYGILQQNLNQNNFAKGVPDNRIDIWHDQLPDYRQFRKIIAQIQHIQAAVSKHRPCKYENEVTV